MKTKLILSLIITVFTFTLSFGQVKVDVENKVNREANQRANRKTDQAIDKTFDKLEEGIGNLFKKKNKKNKGNNQQQEEQVKQNNSTEQKSEQSTVEEPQVQTMNVEWAKFDFVPGDEVIFEDVPSTDEENGEFPSRWDLKEGQVEIAKVNGENVIMFLDGGEIVPYLKNSKEDYLPDVFTIEFDVWFNKGQSTSNRYFIHFRDRKNQWNKGLGERLTITPTGLEFGATDKRYPGTESLNWSTEPDGKWRHISIAYTKGKFKAYMDDTRLINVPHLEENPWGLTIEALAENVYLKNVRIAKGGVKYYERVLSDGKIIVNGIRFDVNQANIKPESNGAINEIFQLMQKQADLNFSVEGHTDSDGDEAQNQTLSEQRAKAVMDRLVSMGISANRLKSAGWGESKPIGENGTAEGKANNRRVEFVKFEGSAAHASGSSIGGSSVGNSAYDNLDKKAIGKKLDELPEQINIPISNVNGIVNGAGTVILYATSDGNLGKMEILDVDKNDGYKLTIRFVTYNYNGSIHSESNHLEIEGTYTCDLDKGEVGGDVQSEQDFHFGKQDSKTSTLYPGEIAILRVLNK
ncbi:MAG: OmpA family protein [Bacteroidetes bacterium]|jgi:OOP family OmpA-OmpF porin|nr:OmpA family protein [Bacteroidota bacterium]